MSLKEIIAKIFLLLFACLTIVVLILIIDSRDEDLTPEAKAFAEYKPIDIDRNFFIAWSGLHAPLGTKDLHAYGQKIYKGEINRREVAELRFNDDAYDKNKTGCTRQDKHYKYWEAYLQNSVCLGAKEVDTVLNQNQEIMTRLQTLYRETPKFRVNMGNHMRLGFVSTQDVLQMQGMLCEKWKSDARDDNGQSALKEWIESTQALKHIIQGDQDFLKLMTWFLIYQKNIDCLPVILSLDEALIKPHANQLVDILDFDFLKLWNLEGALKAEENLLQSFETELDRVMSKFYPPNKARNKFYEAAQDILKLSQTLPLHIDGAAYALHKQYACTFYAFMHCTPYKLMLGNLIFKFERYEDFFIYAHGMTAQQKASIIWIKAHVQDISPEHMERFLKDISLQHNDPINDQPFLWDSERNSIYHHVPDRKEQKDLIYYDD